MGTTKPNSQRDRQQADRQTGRQMEYRQTNKQETILHSNAGTLKFQRLKDSLKVIRKKLNRQLL